MSTENFKWPDFPAEVNKKLYPKDNWFILSIGSLFTLCFCVLLFIQMNRDTYLFVDKNGERVRTEDINRIGASGHEMIASDSSVYTLQVIKGDSTSRKIHQQSQQGQTSVQAVKGDSTVLAVRTDYYVTAENRVKSPVLEWQNHLLVVLVGIFALVMWVLYYKYSISTYVERGKMMDLWRKCAIEKFNCQLEEDRIEGAEKKRKELDKEFENEKVQRQEEKDRKEAEDLMNYYFLLSYIKQGKPMTSETLKEYRKSLEKEYQQVKSLMHELNNKSE